MTWLVLALVAAPIEAAPLGHWTPFLHVPGVIDLAGPRRDGRLVVAAGDGLFLQGTGTTLDAFARGPDGYTGRFDVEAYVALARDRRVRGAGCAFRRDDLYVLDVTAPAVLLVDRDGHAQPFAALPPGAFPNGIAFDDVGRFGFRVLVTAQVIGTTTVFGIDCAGRVVTIGASLPAAEGGIAVAPRSFGRFAGRLIAPDEVSGRILAFDADGSARVVAESGIASGGDIGVESIGFVPRGLGRRGKALLADRSNPGNPHPGTDSILALDASALRTAGVRPGDLLVASEGGAVTVAVRCRERCTVRHVADGPTETHAEGHIAFLRAR